MNKLGVLAGYISCFSVFQVSLFGMHLCLCVGVLKLGLHAVYARRLEGLQNDKSVVIREEGIYGFITVFTRISLATLFKF